MHWTKVVNWGERNYHDFDDDHDDHGDHDDHDDHYDHDDHDDDHDEVYNDNNNHMLNYTLYPGPDATTVDNNEHNAEVFHF